MKRELLPVILSLLIHGLSYGQGEQTHKVPGTVYSREDGQPIPGAIATTTDGQQTAISDTRGRFVLNLPAGEHLLTVSYLGMDTHKTSITVPLSAPLEIRLSNEGLALEGVEVVSTGYQEIPKERATGSFVLLGNELVQRRPGTDLMERLEDVTPGLIFNRGPQAATDPISIRGRGTIFANTSPLIILDNFPYDGPLENINPNDVENITVLKDAAAASIWGARAGNGVIVITTRQGRAEASPQVSLNTNLTVTEAPDLYYTPQMDIPAFLDIERQLFNNGFYNSRINSSNRTPLSPVVETLAALRDDRITQEEADARLSAYRSNDIREDLERYYYSPALDQQYALSIRGGGTANRYAFSLGYDRNNEPVKPNHRQRWTLNGQQNWTLVDGRLEIGTGIYLTRTDRFTGTRIPQGYAYERLADGSGRPLPITGNLSNRYIESVDGDGLLDWKYVPLEEIGLLDYRTQNLDWRANASLSYDVGAGLRVSAQYQYWSNNSLGRDRDPLDSFYTRDQINRFTQRGEDGLFTHPLPLGDILHERRGSASSHSLRSQLSYRREWADRHYLDAIAGIEAKSLEGISSANTFYGYDDGLGTGQPVDHVSRWPMYFNPGSQIAINSGIAHGGNIDRFLSYYTNLGYHFRHRYHLTLSARKDQSNIFGVDTNQKGVPLWSVGTAWTLSEESFAKSNNMPYLKLRATYGYNGNVDKSLSSLVTARYFNFLFYEVVPGALGATVINPPNPGLRWEKIRIANLGLDLETADGRFGTTLEFYNKKGTDLIGDFSVPASTGMTDFTGNFANTLTKGLDLDSRVRLIEGDLSWQLSWMHSWLDEKVLDYEKQPTVANLLSSAQSATPYPISDRPLFGIYTYAWGGLDPDTGDPTGILDGEASGDYSSIIRQATVDNLVYHGPARPTHFGALRNDFSWKGLSLSVNISYRLGYYYKRRSINYFELLRGEIGHGDFDRRWQKPGDEAFTQVPSLPASADNNRNTFYLNSAALVEKGDHIRLNDIRLGYTFDRARLPGLPFRTAELYTYASNLGILWKASDDPLDPDYRTAKPLRGIAFGIRVDF